MDATYCSEQAIDAAALGAMPASSSEARPMQTAGWRDLGKLLRVLGRLEESQIVLKTQVDRLPPSPARDASEVSLGLTLQKLADRERDRRASVQFNYLPWRCEAERAPIPVVEAYDRAIARFSAVADSNDPLIRTQARLNYLTLIAQPRDSSRRGGSSSNSRRF